MGYSFQVHLHCLVTEWTDDVLITPLKKSYHQSRRVTVSELIVCQNMTDCLIHQRRALWSRALRKKHPRIMLCRRNVVSSYLRLWLFSVSNRNSIFCLTRAVLVDCKPTPTAGKFKRHECRNYSVHFGHWHYSGWLEVSVERGIFMWGSNRAKEITYS
jgi:hypothetical protein